MAILLVRVCLSGLAIGEAAGAFKRVYAPEWGELALILGGTPENSVVGRSRK